MFQGRQICIATKHHKEKVIAPLFEKKLGVKCILAENYDTDALGTFSGEIVRSQPALETARRKCLEAMELYQCDLGVANEGSFGAHPTIFFAHADEEVMIFIDKKNDLEIVVKEISIETNFDASVMKSENELKLFADRVLFPSHALILRKSKDDYSVQFKGINDEDTLYSKFHQLIEENGEVYVETDMRAMYNPSRMLVIEKATLKLIEKIQSTCPMCQTPGFGITDVKQGLPCSWCNHPTRSTLSFIYECDCCKFIKEEKFPHQKTTEDPMYCDFCNP